MSKLLSPRDIATEALRMVREVAPHETGVEGVKLDTALLWLDMAVGELAGSMTCWWLVDETLSITLTADTVTYTLSDETGYPTDGIQFFRQVQLADSSGREKPLTIIGRQEYDVIADKDLSGIPSKVYVERDSDPKLSTYKTVGVTGYSLKLNYQKYAADLTAGHGTTNAHGLENAWNRWAIFATAHDIGMGVTRPLPRWKLREIRGERELARTRLSAFQNREKRRPARSKAYKW